jgi:hypothetical protein
MEITHYERKKRATSPITSLEDAASSIRLGAEGAGGTAWLLGVLLRA